jgi:hypothetical protein
LNTKKTYVADLVENLRDGTVTGMSIGFRVIRDEWRTETVETSDGHSVEVEVRRILELQLFEVSAVTFPAYESTDAGLRAAISADELAVADVAAALVRRGDLAAFERRAALLPALADFRDLMPTRAPAEATRGTEEEPGAPTPTVDDTAARMRGLAARYRLPLEASTNKPKEGTAS